MGGKHETRRLFCGGERCWARFGFGRGWRWWTRRTRFGRRQFVKRAQEFCRGAGRFIQHAVTLGLGSVPLVVFSHRRTRRIHKRHICKLFTRRRTVDTHHQLPIRLGSEHVVQNPVCNEVAEPHVVVACRGCLARVEVELRGGDGWRVEGKRWSHQQNHGQNERREKNEKSRRDFDRLVAKRFMSRPPSTPPPADPPELPKPTESTEPSDKFAIMVPAEWGLSNAQVKELLVAMRRMIRKEGCPERLHLDVVQDAFVVALSKPISERKRVTDWQRFVSWMATLAKYSALTNRNTEKRRREDELSDEEIAELLAVPAPDTDFLALEALEKACLQLAPEHQALIKAHYFDGKTIQQLADEQGKLPWTTMKSRVDRVLELLRCALQSIIVAIILLVTKNVRAQGTRLARHVSHLLPHATHAASAMAVTMACGVLVPSASNAMEVSPRYAAVGSSAPPSAPVAIAMMPAEPSLAPEVEPEKPITIDELEKQWSADDMNSFKIVRYLQATMLPFAFLMTPAISQVACTGSGQQTPPPQEPDDEDYGGPDPYEMMCESTHRLGGECPSKADWCASMGKRPAPAPKGCQ
jgi:DNA-directed RNA polymerase specialized sigma24 family protein